MNTVRSIIFTILLAISFVFSSLAQQEFKLSGVVMENGTKNRIALSSITNLHNKYSVGSNDMGLFEIRASIFDTLVISKRGFQDRVIVVVSNKDLVVYMNSSHTLNEVVVFGENKKQAMEDIKKDFRNKGSFYAGKPPFLSFLFSPLTALYETFGRTPKNARRFNNYYNTEIQQTHIDQFFNRTLINKYTALEGNELDRFMINYRPDYEKTKNWNVYDGVKYIKDSFKQYADTAGKK
ncbi:MAG: hypothetical protein REI78_15865 [Pedobacter sp.]|nr:hypothetical protein [Pedobacter sp.]MDQ8054506.1 hypothetical protein [Pedobacter sp.]